MVVKLLLIALASAAVFWLVARGWPGLKTFFRGRVLPLLASPLILVLLKRLAWLLLRIFLFRR